jgi:kynurenine 3-monooxygenase
VVKGRSINMALSRRGRDALAYVNCEDVIVENGIPMHSRMLHDTNCHTEAVPYGIGPDHVIYLNKITKKSFYHLVKVH